tara:strand:- start:5725 stop:12864 length:7140 start_codon:yes stop_codon:yes gene_type:complete
MAVSYKSFVEQVKERHNLSDSLSEADIYNYGKKRYPGVNVDTSESPFSIETDNNPSTLAHLMRYGIDDDSWDWAKHAYANSLQGTIEKRMTGELPFGEIETEYEDLPWYQQSLSMIASFAMPMDMLTLWGGGAIGRVAVGAGKVATKKLVQKGATDLAKKGIRRKITEQGRKYGIKNAGQLADDMISGAAAESISLGIYEGSKAGIEASYQNKHNPLYKDNPMSVLGETASGFAHGMFTGGVLGLTGGFMGNKFNRLKRAKSRYPSLLNFQDKSKFESALKFYGKSGIWSFDPVGTGALSLITAGGRIYDGDFQAEDLIKDLLVNSAFMYGTKKKHQALNYAFEKSGLKQYVNKSYQEYSEAYKKRKDSLSEEFENTEVIIDRFNEKADKAEAKGDKKTAETFRDFIKELESERAVELDAEIKRIQEIEGWIARYNDLTKWYDTKGDKVLEDIKTKKIKKDSKEAEELLKVVDEQQVLMAELDAIITDGIKNGKYDKVDMLGDVQKEYGFTKSSLESIRNEVDLISKSLFGELGKREQAEVKDHRYYSDKIMLDKDLMKTFGLKQKDLEKLPIERLKDIYNRKKEQVEETIDVAQRLTAAKEGKGLVIKEGKVSKSKDLDLKQSEYNTIVTELKAIKEGKDTESAASIPTAKLLKGKFESGEKYFKGVSEFNQAAFKQYMAKGVKPQNASKYGREVAKFLNYLGKLKKDVDQIDASDIINYMMRRRIMNNNKPLGSAETSGISTFANFLIDVSVGKFNKKISFLNQDSLFKQINKKLKAGTETAIEGVRREAVKIGENLSKEKNDQGYSLVAELMAKIGIRSQEVTRITKNDLKKDSKGRDYLDIRETEIAFDPASGEIVGRIGTGKVDTGRAYLYIPKQLANKLNKFFDGGNKFLDKHKKAVGQKITLSKNKQKLNDLRAKIQSDVLIKHPNLSSQINYVLRHDRSRISPIYEKMPPESAIDFQVKLHEKGILGVKTPKAKAEPKKIIKINEIDSAETSVEYWKQEQARVKERLKTAKTASQRETLQGQKLEAGMKLSASKKLVDYNKKIAKAKEGKTKQNLIINRDKVIKQLGLQKVLKEAPVQKTRVEIIQDKLDKNPEYKKVIAKEKKAKEKVIKAKRELAAQIPTEGFMPTEANKKGLKKVELAERALSAVRVERQKLEEQVKLDTPVSLKEAKKPEKTTISKKSIDITDKPSTPHESNREKAFRKLDEGQKKHQRLYEEGKDPKQKKIADEKDVVKSALRGGWALKPEAEKLIKNYIKIHNAYAKRLKTDKEFAKKEGVGNVEYHETWVKDYKEMLNLLKKGDPRDLQHKIEDYNNISSITSRRKKILQDAHIVQRDIGIGKAKNQLTKEQYKKRLKQDIEDALGEKDITSLAELETPAIIDYMNHIQKATSSKNSNIKESLRSMYQRAEEASDIARLISSEKSEILNAINPMTKGDFSSKHMNRETMKEYRAIVEEMARNVGKSQTFSEMSWSMFGETDLKMPGKIRRGMTPAYSLLKHFGGKYGEKIANTLLDFDVVSSLHRGKISQAMYEIKTLEKNFEVGDRHMLRFKDKTFRKDLSKEEKQFIENMNNPEKAEYQARKIMDKTYDFYWNAMPKAISKYGGRAKVEKIEKFLGKRYLEDYMTHKVNPILIPILSDLTTISKQPFWKKKFNEEMDSYANRMARKSNLKKGSIEYTQKVKDIKLSKEHQEIVKSDIVGFFGKAMNRLDNPNLRERGVTLDRYTEITSPRTGKIIRVKSYNETLEGTFEAYGVGMSKYLSTLRFFPEFTTLGRKFGLSNVRSDMFDMLNRKGDSLINRNWYDYTAELIQLQLGFNSGVKRSYTDKDNRRIGKFTTTSAAVGLFTPTAGLKNILLGGAQTMSKFGITNTLNASMKFMDRQERLEARRKGWTPYGTKENVFEATESYTQDIPLLGKLLSTDRMFIFMSKTEEFNRFVAGKAGEMYFAETLNALKGSKGVTGMSKKSAEREMQDVFKFSKEEIKHMKDNSIDFLYSKENEGNMNWIMNKAGHYSHVSTQGGTSTALLPLWMSRKAAKPFTLFYRIAASTTHNNYLNYVKPIKENGNFMPMLRFAVSSGLSGMSMYGIYDYFLGKEEPLSQSDKNIIYTKLLPYLWRAEFFGVFGEAVNPYNNWMNLYGKEWKAPSLQDMLSTNMFEPVILRNAKLLLNQTYKLGTGAYEYLDDATSEKGAIKMKQAIATTLSEGLVGWGQIEKIWKNRDKNYETHKRIRTITRQFYNEKGYSKPSVVLESERSPFYKKMKSNFWSGSEKDFAKTYWAAYAYITSELEQDGNRNPASRSKLAKRFIKQSLKSYDPLAISDESKDRVMSKRDEFLKYLDKDMRDKTKKLSRDYKSRLGYLLRAVNKYKKKMSVYPNL